MLKILIVDDSKSAQLQVYDILSRHGACDQAYNGREAVEFFEASLKDNTLYDLVIMDIVMPEMDGFTAVKKIKELQDEHEIREADRAKIVMLTSKTDPDNMMKAHFEMGVSTYITKPFEEETLVEALSNLGLINA